MPSYTPDLHGGAALYESGCRGERIDGYNGDSKSYSLHEYRSYFTLDKTTVAGSDQITWEIGTTAISIPSNRRIGFGICLEAPFADGVEPTMYEYSMVARVSGQVAVMAVAGQLDNSTAPVRWVGEGTNPRNRACFNYMPYQHASTGRVSAQGKVIIGKGLAAAPADEQPDVPKPVIIGVVIENRDASAENVHRGLISISGYRYANPIQVHGTY